MLFLYRGAWFAERFSLFDIRSMANDESEIDSTIALGHSDEFVDPKVRLLLDPLVDVKFETERQLCQSAKILTLIVSQKHS